MEERREMFALFVSRAKKGDRYAMDVLLRHHRELLYRFASGLCQNSDEAADVIGETLLRAHRSLHTFNHESELSTWLIRITMNVFLDHRKRNSRLQTLRLAERESMVEFDPAFVSKEHGPAELSEMKEAEARMLEAVSVLPMPHREMVRMHYFEESSYDEIAEVFEIPVGTVKSRMNRARWHLATILSREPAFTPA